MKNRAENRAEAAIDIATDLLMRLRGMDPSDRSEKRFDRDYNRRNIVMMVDVLASRSRSERAQR